MYCRTAIVYLADAAGGGGTGRMISDGGCEQRLLHVRHSLVAQ
jgi:hypothetical protein